MGARHDRIMGTASNTAIQQSRYAHTLDFAGACFSTEALWGCAFGGIFTFSMSADGAIVNDQTLMDEEDRAAEVGKRAGGIVDGQEDAAVAGDDDAGPGLSDGRAQDQA